MNITDMSDQQLQVMRRQYVARVKRLNADPRYVGVRSQLRQDVLDAQKVIEDEIKRRSE